jgi:hypothetical protein
MIMGSYQLPQVALAAQVTLAKSFGILPQQCEIKCGKAPADLQTAHQIPSCLTIGQVANAMLIMVGQVF